MNMRSGISKKLLFSILHIPNKVFFFNYCKRKMNLSVCLFVELLFKSRNFHSKIRLVINYESLNNEESLKLRVYRNDFNLCP